MKTVNFVKTKCLIVTRKLHRHIELEGHTFRRLSQFKYVKSIITQECDIKIEIFLRIQFVSEGYYRIYKNFLKSKTSKNFDISRINLNFKFIIKLNYRIN